MVNQKSGPVHPANKSVTKGRFLHENTAKEVQEIESFTRDAIHILDGSIGPKTSYLADILETELAKTGHHVTRHGSVMIAQRRDSALEPTTMRDKRALLDRILIESGVDKPSVREKVIAALEGLSLQDEKAIPPEVKKTLTTFANPPTELQTRGHAPTVPLTPEVVKQAKSIVNAYDRRRKKGVEFSAAALEAVSEARRVVRAAERRKKAELFP
jgi:hypothetical protein